MNFIAVPVTGINERKVSILNSKVQSFNAKLKEKINNAKISNLKFKSILSGTNVNTIMVDGKPRFYYNIHLIPKNELFYF